MERLDDGATRLRSGTSVWQRDAAPHVHRRRSPVQLSTDIVIIGAGITGAFLAERFTREGRSVVLLDRRPPASGSTAASTAMVLWELDAPLIELEDRLGFDAAASIAGQCRRTVAGIGKIVDALGIDCDFRLRPSLYLAGDKLDAADLREERRIRDKAGIEGAFLDSDDLAARGIMGEAGLFYAGSADVDPVKLARGLLQAAATRGAILVSPATALTYEVERDGVTVITHEGDTIRAKTMALANGYELPDFVPTPGHKLMSTWAIGSEPQTHTAWPDGALVWEASDPYLYMRLTADGRVVAGGADESFEDENRREQLTPSKAGAILEGIVRRCPALDGTRVDYCWSGVFGETADSLPMIGPLPGRAHSLAGFGYGGNGIVFSAIAADLLNAELNGRRGDNADFYALDRSGS